MSRHSGWGTTVVREHGRRTAVRTADEHLAREQAHQSR